MTTRKYFYIIPTQGEERDDLGEPVLIRLNSAGADFEVNLMVASQIVHSYGKLASGAEYHYEICCSFPQNVRTLHALESSIFIRILCSLLRFSDLYLVETIRSPKLGSLLLIYELNFEGPCCTGFN